MTFGVAILGSGIFAREEHKPAVEAAKNLELRAIYSRSLKSAKSLDADESKVKLYSDDSGPGKSLADLLARPDIDAVIIALPILNQPDYIRKSLLAGKHVLSEKPVAENVKDAEALIKWYRSEIDTKKVTWGVAENMRFMDTFDHAAEAVKTKGRQLTFRMWMTTLVEGGKYFETEWRKVPTHQGGFLLDGGVHFVAVLRLLLGPENPLVSVSAHSAQLQKHLPPVDTVNAIAKAKNGAIGTITMSFGTTEKDTKWIMACEDGVVSATWNKVTVGDQTTEHNDAHGVIPEVQKWGEAMAAGTVNERQLPEEALADLEVLEAMLRSGERGGESIDLRLQVMP